MEAGGFPVEAAGGVSPRSRSRASGAAAAGVLVALIAACARPGAPPGGPPDLRPPVVLATVPGALDDVPGFRGPVRFEFDERISEQVGAARLEDAVIVSPRTGDVRVGHGRRSLSIDVEGGFRDGVVYRVTLLPGVRDLFGNGLRDPFELVFTTGAEPEETVLAGEAWDRVTGRGLQDLALQAVGADSLVHVASSGEEGIYAFRYLPGGRYTVTAFQDNDRDHAPGPAETQGRADVSLASGDTVFVDVPVLLPDTTAAILLAADLLDSLTVALRFDDYLDPETPVEAGSVTLRDGAGTLLPWVAVFHEVAWADHRAAVLDSLARADMATGGGAQPVPAAQPAPVDVPPDSAAVAALDAPAADTAAVLGPGGVPVTQPPRPVGPPPLPGAAIPGVEAARARGRTLPGRRLAVVLQDPVPAGVEVRVTVTGVRNLNGVEGGGGDVPLERPQPADTAGAGGSDGGR